MRHTSRWTLLVMLPLIGGCGRDSFNLAKVRDNNAKREHHELQERERLAQKKVMNYAQVIEYAITHNLDQYVEEQQALIQKEIAKGQILNLLPKINIEGNYSWRDKQSASSSQSLATGTESLTASISSNREMFNGGVGAAWNLLDFGLSYSRWKQEKARTWIANKEAERAVQNLVLSATRAYWKVITSRQAAAGASEIVELAEQLQERVRDQISRKIVSEMQGLEHSERLLQMQMLFKSYASEYEKAKADLANLLGLSPNTELVIEEPVLTPIAKTDVNIRLLEESALRLRPELSVGDLEEKIAIEEVKSSLISLIPSANLFVDRKTDSNSFVVNKDWFTAGVRATWNLLSIPKSAQSKKTAKAKQELSHRKRLAVAAGVLSQVHLANLDIENQRTQLSLAEEMAEVKQRQLDVVKRQHTLGFADAVLLLRLQADAFSAKINALTSYADLKVGLERLSNSVGQPLLFANAEEKPMRLGGVSTKKNMNLAGSTPEKTIQTRFQKGGLSNLGQVERTPKEFETVLGNLLNDLEHDSELQVAEHDTSNTLEQTASATPQKPQIEEKRGLAETEKKSSWSDGLRSFIKNNPLSKFIQKTKEQPNDNTAETETTKKKRRLFSKLSKEQKDLLTKKKHTVEEFISLAPAAKVKKEQDTDLTKALGEQENQLQIPSAQELVQRAPERPVEKEVLATPPATMLAQIKEEEQAPVAAGSSSSHTLTIISGEAPKTEPNELHGEELTAVEPELASRVDEVISNSFDQELAAAQAPSEEEKRIANNIEASTLSEELTQTLENQPSTTAVATTTPTPSIQKQTTARILSETESDLAELEKEIYGSDFETQTSVAAQTPSTETPANHDAIDARTERLEATIAQLEATIAQLESSITKKDYLATATPTDHNETTTNLTDNDESPTTTNLADNNESPTTTNLAGNEDTATAEVASNDDIHTIELAQEGLTDDELEAEDEALVASFEKAIALTRDLMDSEDEEMPTQVDEVLGLLDSGDNTPMLSGNHEFDQELASMHERYLEDDDNNEDPTPVKYITKKKEPEQSILVKMVANKRNIQWLSNTESQEELADASERTNPTNHTSETAIQEQDFIASTEDSLAGLPTAEEENEELAESTEFYVSPYTGKKTPVEESEHATLFIEEESSLEEAIADDGDTSDAESSLANTSENDSETVIF